MKKSVLNDRLVLNYAKTYLVSYYKKNNFSKTLIEKNVKFNLDGVRREANIGEKIMPFIGKDNLKVLDFGCGSGLVSYGLSKVLGGSITGVDTDNEMIRISKRWLKRSKINNIHFINMDVRRFDERFDLIVCTDVLEHVSDRRKCLNILYEHLNPNGLLYLKTTNRLCAYNFLFDNHYMIPFVSVLEKNLRNKITSFILGKRTDDVVDYSVKWELEDQFHNVGFQIVKDFRPFNHFLMAHEYLVEKAN